MAHDKRLKAGYETFDRTKVYSLDEAIKLVRANAKAKFDETVELSMNLGIDPRHADQMVRGLLSLPNGTGKTLRVGVFARGAKAEEARAAGCGHRWRRGPGGEVPGGRVRVRPLHRDAGHDGAGGSAGQDPGPARADAEPEARDGDDGREGCRDGGQGRPGRVSGGEGRDRPCRGSARRAFEDGKLAENIRAFVDAIQKAKPTGAKGTYLQKASLSSTMGPGVKLDICEPGAGVTVTTDEIRRP